MTVERMFTLRLICNRLLARPLRREAKEESSEEMAKTDRRRKGWGEKESPNWHTVVPHLGRNQ